MEQNVDDPILNATQARLLLAELVGTKPVTRQRFAFLCRTKRIKAVLNSLHGSWEVPKSEVIRFFKEDYQPHRSSRECDRLAQERELTENRREAHTSASKGGTTPVDASSGLGS